MKTSIYIVSLISVYLIGIATHAIWDRNHKTEGAFHDQSADSAGSEAPGSSDAGTGQPTEAPNYESQTDDERHLALQPIVNEAILNGGKLEEQLLMMGLTEEMLKEC